MTQQEVHALDDKLWDEASREATRHFTPGTDAYTRNVWRIYELKAQEAFA